jgi:antitoxin FitA
VASLTIRDLDDETKERLRVRAARRRRSMEEEARQILREAVAQDDVPPTNLADAIGRRFRPLGGVDLALPERGPIRPPPRPRR